MASFLDKEIDIETKLKCQSFIKKIESDMHYKAAVAGDASSWEWVDEIEKACPFIDNVIRRPKLALIQEENVMKIEKAKKITVASVKDLSRHTNYISKVNENDEVQPSKILDIRNEETYNIYENRFLYTLINDLNRFIMKKEKMLENLEIIDEKTMEYAANTTTTSEKVNIEVKISSTSLPQEKDDKNLERQIESIKLRIKRIREYITSWQRSEMMKALDKAHVTLINPPVKKTNIILKNPNFQVAVNLWSFIQKYDYENKDNTKDGYDTDGNNNLRGFLDHSFLIDYFVLDSITSSRKEQKERLASYAVYMLTQEISRTISLLMNNGVKITDEELLKLIAKEIKNEKNNHLIGINDVKKKFKSAMDEYLERTQENL